MVTVSSLVLNPKLLTVLIFKNSLKPKLFKIGGLLRKSLQPQYCITGKKNQQSLEIDRCTGHGKTRLSRASIILSFHDDDAPATGRGTLPRPYRKGAQFCHLTELFPALRCFIYPQVDNQTYSPEGKCKHNFI